MKRIAVCLVFLLLTSGAFAAQTTDTKPARKGNSNSAAKKPAVDCSSMTDEQINTAVKERLASTPSLKDSAINSATSGGVVTLTGKVKTGQLKGVATNQVKRVACVQKVDNKCETESKAAPTAKNKDTK